jgi:hypothetical protein
MKRTRHFDEKMKMMGFSSPKTNEAASLKTRENGVTHVLDYDERVTVVEKNEDAFEKVLDLLNEVDPMGLAFVSRHEYYVEAVDLVENLFECNTSEDTRRVFKETFNWWFGEDWSERFELDKVPAEQLLKIKLESFQVN